MIKQEKNFMEKRNRLKKLKRNLIVLIPFMLLYAVFAPFFARIDKMLGLLAIYLSLAHIPFIVLTMMAYLITKRKEETI